jgi:putative ATPase
MKGLGYSAGYKYAHDYADAAVAQDHLPENLAGRRYYHPSDRGREATIAERIRVRAERLAAQGEQSTAPADEPEWEPSKRRKAREAREAEKAEGASGQ